MLLLGQRTLWFIFNKIIEHWFLMNNYMLLAGIRAPEQSLKALFELNCCQINVPKW